MVIERLGLTALAVLAALGTLAGAVWWYGETRHAAGVRDEAARQAQAIAELNRQIMAINDAATDAYTAAGKARTKIVNEAVTDVVVVDRLVSKACDLPGATRARLNTIGGAP